MIVTQGHSSVVCKQMSPSSVKEINKESRNGIADHKKGRSTIDLSAVFIILDTVDEAQSRFCIYKKHYKLEVCIGIASKCVGHYRVSKELSIVTI